ncbi:flippase [Olivibacter sitiensis]|uniref:flippase n=1 Tax=Olivibacter sitiensis TaxID=376470 RepID=UPI0003FA2AF0|nr:flippase [Olivibacter sitiensis]
MKSNYWIKSGFINLMQNGMNVLLAFLNFMLLIRILSKEEYGAWVLLVGTVSFLEMLRNGLVQNALVKHLAAGTEQEKKRILTSSLAISLTVTSILILLVLALGPFLSRIYAYEDFGALLCLYMIVFFVSGLQNIMNATELANFSFKGNFVSITAKQAILLLFVGYCYIYKVVPSLRQLLYLQIGSAILCTYFAWLVTNRHLHFSRYLDFHWVKKLLNFGKYSFGSSISSSLANNIDQWMLGALLSKSAAASYNLAIRITNLVEIPTNAMATIVFPQGAKRSQEKGSSSVKYLYEKSVGSVLALLVPAMLGIYIFGDQVIHLLAGATYEDAAPLLNITLLFVIFIPYGRQVGIMLEAVGKAKTNFFLVLATASINIVLNFTFIRHFGILGAAYATLTANIIGFILSQYMLHRMYKVNWWAPWIYAWQFYPSLIDKLFLNKEKK